MFKNTRAYSGFSVDNLEKAKQFYSELLGLEVSVDNKMDILELQIAGGTKNLIYPKPDHTPATFTILNFPVKNVEKTVADLKHQGVNFESYDLEKLKTDDDHIFRGGGPKIAWFKDPAGNILSILSA